MIQHSECQFFTGKMETVLSSNPRELVQFLQLINQLILLCASLSWMNQEFLLSNFIKKMTNFGKGNIPIKVTTGLA
jgi:hypothetical protein